MDGISLSPTAIYATNASLERPLDQYLGMPRTSLNSRGGAEGINSGIGFITFYSAL
jgi:hypothetical protein